MSEAFFFTRGDERSKSRNIRITHSSKTGKEVQSIRSGLLNFYRHFISNYPDTAKSLADITEKKSSRKVVRTDDCLHSLETLKNILTSDPGLLLLDLN
ncbi:Pol polyprotein [Plakobranchus ocellatus]|uniref:Pol polyprotein n=1 Tax=Plakobranchus ocellatus TaxID=259542 RepID=A0AAV4CYD0_9GAST|nr:Pol polyprotein [Plakobranchus ocellatus]